MMPDESFEHIADIFDRLVEDSRRNFVSESAMESMTKEGLAESRRIVNEAIESGLTTAAALARRTGLKETAISEFRNNTWKGKKGTLATTASILARAVNQLLHEQRAAETQIGGFVRIRFANAVFAIAQWAVTRRKIAAFVTYAGLGKSITLDALLLEFPGSVKITVKQTRRTIKSFLQLWARAFGLKDTGRTGDIQDRIIRFLKSTSRPVFIDEAHKLSVAALDVMREIWDEAKIPIILAATPSLYHTMTSRPVGSESGELMDQLYSRVALFRDLTKLENEGTGDEEPVVSAQDVRKIFARGKVRLTDDGANFLCAIANHPGAGGLRVCEDLVQMSVDLYPGEPVTALLLEQALRTRLGIKEAGFIIDQLELRPPAVATKVG